MASETVQANPAQAKIAETIAGNDVVLFMKGTKQFPQCGFSATAVKILEHLRRSRNSTSKANSSAVAISCARCMRPASCMI